MEPINEESMARWNRLATGSEPIEEGILGDIFGALFGSSNPLDALASKAKNLAAGITEANNLQRNKNGKGAVAKLTGLVTLAAQIKSGLEKAALDGSAALRKAQTKK